METSCFTEHRASILSANITKLVGSLCQIKNIVFFDFLSLQKGKQKYHPVDAKKIIFFSKECGHNKHSSSSVNQAILAVLTALNARLSYDNTESKNFSLLFVICEASLF